MLWTYTTPSEDQRENFTWVDNISNTEFWDSASSVTSIDDTTIIVTHSPDIGATMQYSLDISNSITYTVVNLTDDKINVSYLDNTGNTSYTEFDRTIVIKRNVSQVTIINYPKEGLEQLLTYLKFTINPDIEFSLDPYADLTLLYEIEVVEVYKTSKN